MIQWPVEIVAKVYECKKICSLHYDDLEGYN